MSILGLIPTPPGEVVTGTAVFKDQDLLKLTSREMQSYLGNRIGMIFQDPIP